MWQPVIRLVWSVMRDTIFFNQEDIGNIVHHGFVNEDHETYIKLLDALHRERWEERDEGNI